jgi:hypothetical protein
MFTESVHIKLYEGSVELGRVALTNYVNALYLKWPVNRHLNPGRENARDHIG